MRPGPAPLRPGLIAALLSLAGTAALAAPDGWSLTGAVSEQLSLRSGGETEGLRSTTRASFTLLRESTLTSLSITGAIAPVIARDNDSEGIAILAPSLGGTLTHQADERLSLTAGLRSAFSSTRFSDEIFAENPDDPLDPGDFLLQSGSATQVRLSGNLGLDWAAGERDTLKLALTASRTDFLDGATSLIPSTTAKLTATWSHAFTPRIDGTLTAGLTWFTSEAPTRPETRAFELKAGFEREITRRLSVTGSLGASLTETSRLIGQALRLRGSDLTLGALGDIGLTWNTPETRVTFTLSQTLQPSSAGELQNTSALRLGFEREVTAEAKVGLDLRAQRQRASGGEGSSTTSLQVAPYISYTIAPETALRLGYTFEQRSGTPSHTVGLTLSRDVDLLK